MEMNRICSLSYAQQLCQSIWQVFMCRYFTHFLRVFASLSIERRDRESIFLYEFYKFSYTRLRRIADRQPKSSSEKTETSHPEAEEICLTCSERN